MVELTICLDGLALSSTSINTLGGTVCCLGGSRTCEIGTEDGCSGTPEVGAIAEA
jgi:hypothetical protein